MDGGVCELDKHMRNDDGPTLYRLYETRASAMASYLQPNSRQQMSPVGSGAARSLALDKSLTRTGHSTGVHVSDGTGQAKNKERNGVS